MTQPEEVMKDYVDWEGQGFRHLMEFLGVYEVGASNRGKRKHEGTEESTDEVSEYGGREMTRAVRHL